MTETAGTAIRGGSSMAPASEVYIAQLKQPFLSPKKLAQKKQIALHLLSDQAVLGDKRSYIISAMCWWKAGEANKGFLGSDGR